MDMIAPLAKTGLISEPVNLGLAVVIGFVFGFGLYHAGFTDGRRIGRVFYLKEVSVPIAMFTAIASGMLGLWGLALLGILDISKVYFLPTYLAPMAVGGLLFGVGMVVGGYCPGTAMAAVVTGKVDAAVFVVGFLAGSLLFGDLFPVWGNFYTSDFRGVLRLDQLFGLELGTTILIMTVIAIAGSMALRWLQRFFWFGHKDNPAELEQVFTLEGGIAAVGLSLATVMAFFPTSAFISIPEPGYYLVPRQEIQAPPARDPGLRKGKSSSVQ